MRDTCICFNKARVYWAIYYTTLQLIKHYHRYRYPNSHTHYFSCTLLYLFAEANQESIQEQITRVLLERLIVNRPHPWGKFVVQKLSKGFKQMTIHVSGGIPPNH